jgi:hypothetical protein
MIQTNNVDGFEVAKTNARIEMMHGKICAPLLAAAHIA